MYSGTPLSEHLGVALKMFGNREVFGKESFNQKWENTFNFSFIEIFGFKPKN